MSIGDNIKRLRKENKMTQTELANRLDKSLRTIQKYESNQIKPPLYVLKDISDVFMIDISELIYFNDIKNDRYLICLEKEELEIICKLLRLRNNKFSNLKENVLLDKIEISLNDNQ